jgi:hypothetical protein
MIDLIISTHAMILLATYMMPTFIAIARNHNQTTTIAILNLVFGWSVIGWVILLLWSANDNAKQELR